MSDGESGISGAPATTPAVAEDDRLASLYPNDGPAGAEPDGEAATVEPLAGSAAQLATEYHLTAPEGFDLSPGMIREAAPVFQELGLDSDGANKLMPLAGKLADHIVTGFETEHSALKKDWAKTTLADPQIGGQNWSETRRLVDKAMNYVGADTRSELTKLLDKTGLGNHPAFVRAFRQFGELVGKMGSPPPRAQDRASVLYPND